MLLLLLCLFLCVAGVFSQSRMFPLFYCFNAAVSQTNFTGTSLALVAGQTYTLASNVFATQVFTLSSPTGGNYASSTLLSHL